MQSLRPHWMLHTTSCKRTPIHRSKCMCLSCLTLCTTWAKWTLKCSSTEAALNDLGNSIPIQVVASLRNCIRTYILPWGVIPHMLESDLSMDESDVAQLMDLYHWQLGPTRGHVQQLLTSILLAMRNFRSVVHSRSSIL